MQVAGLYLAHEWPALHSPVRSLQGSWVLYSNYRNRAAGPAPYVPCGGHGHTAHGEVISVVSMVAGAASTCVCRCGWRTLTTYCTPPTPRQPPRSSVRSRCLSTRSRSCPPPSTKHSSRPPPHSQVEEWPASMSSLVSSLADQPSPIARAAEPSCPQGAGWMGGPGARHGAANHGATCCPCRAPPPPLPARLAPCGVKPPVATWLHGYMAGKGGVVGSGRREGLEGGWCGRGG